MQQINRLRDEMEVSPNHRNNGGRASILLSYAALALCGDIQDLGCAFTRQPKTDRTERQHVGQIEQQEGTCRIWDGPTQTLISAGEISRRARLGVAIMINVPAGARVLLATRPIDFRKGAHSLAVLAQEVLAEDPFSGAVIVYRSKRGDRPREDIGLGYSSGLGAGVEAYLVSTLESLSLWPKIILARWPCSGAQQPGRRGGFHRLGHCLTGVCATGSVQVTIAIARVLSDEAVVRPPDQRAFTDVEF